MEASSAPTRVRKGPNVRWTTSDTQLLLDWFCARDENGVPKNFHLYRNGNKSEACQRLLKETSLDTLRPEISKDKTRKKIIQMVTVYKSTRAPANALGWGVDATKHGIVGEDTNGETIKEAIKRKCSYYYEFDDLMGDLPAINPPFLIESTRSKPDSETESTISKPDSETEPEEVDSNTKTKEKEDVSRLEHGDWTSKTLGAAERNASESNHENVNTWPHESSLPSSSIFSIDHPLVAPNRSDLSNGAKGLNQISMKRKTASTNVDSDREETRHSKKKRSDNQSFAEAPIPMPSMKFKELAAQLKADHAAAQARLEAGMKQRDRHYERLVLQHQETLRAMKTQHEKTVRSLRKEHEETVWELQMQHEETKMKLKAALDKASHKEGS